MKRVDGVKKGEQWIAESAGKTIARAPVKTGVVRRAASIARADPEPVTVKIHKQNGRIQEERTNPRSGDPRSSKG